MARRRRPAAETRAEMLEAGRRLLAEHGPASLRLDDVAAEVGVSRQAVLHHFVSREGLMRAVVSSAWGELFDDLGALAPDLLDQPPRVLLDTVDEVVRVRGHARLGAWLLLSGEGLPDAAFQDVLAGLPKAVRAGAPASWSDEDARFGLVLIGAALFGDALFGARIRQALGLPDSEADRAEFRAWLAERLES